MIAERLQTPMGNGGRGGCLCANGLYGGAIYFKDVGRGSQGIPLTQQSPDHQPGQRAGPGARKKVRLARYLRDMLKYSTPDRYDGEAFCHVYRTGNASPWRASGGGNERGAKPTGMNAGCAGRSFRFWVKTRVSSQDLVTALVRHPGVRHVESPMLKSISLRFKGRPVQTIRSGRGKNRKTIELCLGRWQDYLTAPDGRVMAFAVWHCPTRPSPDRRARKT